MVLFLLILKVEVADNQVVTRSGRHADRLIFSLTEHELDLLWLIELLLEGIGALGDLIRQLAFVVLTPDVEAI